MKKLITWMLKDAFSKTKTKGFTGPTKLTHPGRKAPRSAPYRNKVKWLRGEVFEVLIDGAVVTMRHHNPERLRAALASPRVTLVEIHPKYELLRVHLKRGGIPLRFYMTSGLLEPCSLGSYVWTVRKRKLADDYVDY